jgi:acyl transferase domain-containing protein/predicted O-methyltransferase YrrM/acyl carrier protein
MACRLPGVSDVEEFWRVLEGGVETVARLSEAELLAAGEDPALLARLDYVRAAGVLPDADRFDAELFGCSPHEAAVLDPQQRLFLECSWTALEHAGYDPTACPGAVGVYAGAGWNGYFLFNVSTHPDLIAPTARQQTLLANERDNLALRVSYKLGLEGPSITVQTGCSTSLVAVCLACQSLLSFQSDMALAGGVSVRVPQVGYVYQPGGAFSRAGRCRAFDAQADGTVAGSGVGAVVLRRLEDALADGDRVHAVIRGAAVNNDGAAKVGYAAPSVDRQAAVIREAQAVAMVGPETITYVEAHGTGTAVGDPIEVAALTQAFRAATDDRGYCAIGSVKTNVGHLDAAAGVAGLIKTTLALAHGQIPPSLHFDRPNPAIDFASSPFYVNDTLSDWVPDGVPRRAGVSSFGIGGTNAHVVLEEAPRRPPTPATSDAQVLPLSARTEAALDEAAVALREHLARHPRADVGDVASTLQVGRTAFAHRQALVCRGVGDALAALATPARLRRGCASRDGGGAAFMFAGQGAQHVDMGRGLYRSRSAFREEVDHCVEILRSQHGLELLDVLYSDSAAAEQGDEALHRTEHAQPALFVLAYALARTWMSHGVGMEAAIGHSVGEYVAATLAGVFALEDALALVVARGRLLQALPAGAMLAVPLPPEELERLLDPSVAIAAVNGPERCVASGPEQAVEELAARLTAAGVACARLRTSHAFHSPMVEPALAPFAECFRGVRLAAPRIPFVSCVSGTWIADAQATDPGYWTTHMRSPMRFADGLRCLARETDRPLLEVGPARSTTGFATRHPDVGAERVMPPSLGHSGLPSDDEEAFLHALGGLWAVGVKVDWTRLHEARARRRVPLPTYPFQRRRHWIAPRRPDARPASDRMAVFDVAVTAARREGAAQTGACDAERRRTQLAILERLSAAYMAAALAQLGWDGSADAGRDPAAFAARCGALPHYRRLVADWVQASVQAGWLRPAPDDGHGAPKPSTIADPATLADEARPLWAEAPEVLDLVERCGARLSAVVRGAIDPVELFVPVVDAAEAAPGRVLGTEYAPILHAAARGLVEGLPRSDGLRVLEVGGGTGIATAELLAALPADRTDYVFTDASEAFVSRARRRYAGLPRFRADVLDVDEPPRSQGFADGSFDVVVAANVLHATYDVDRALRHVASLLAPGGLLLLAEITRPTLDFAVTYALLMGSVRGHARSAGDPFLSREGWRAALSSPFAQVAVVPEDDLLGSHVFLAGTAAASASLPRRRGDVSDWFSVPSWRRAAPVARRARCPSAQWLAFVDGSDLASDLVSRLKQAGEEVTTVRPGRAYRRCAAAAFELSPSAGADYRRLLAELADDGRMPTDVVHLWGLAAADDPTAVRGTGRDRSRGVDSLVLLVQAIGAGGCSDPLALTVVTSAAHDVTGETVTLAQAPLLGLCRAIPLEHPNVTCRSVDVAPSHPGGRADVGQQLYDELRGASGNAVVAHRGGHRWVEAVERCRLDRPGRNASRLRERGVYLVTGGLGMIGAAVAEQLAASVRARLVLVGRSGAGAGAERVDALRRHGADVLVLPADVTDAERMRAVVEMAEARFGPINGAIHAAGVLGEGALQHKSLEQVDAVLAPKVTGTLVLHELFAERELDFLILFSSLSSRRPGFGQVAYAAANSFLDAFAHSKEARRHGVTTCINWDVWQGRGMAYAAPAPAVLQGLKQDDFGRRGIRADEGVDAFERILASGLPQVLVASSDYLDLLEARDSDLSQIYLDTLAGSGAVTQQPRPELATTYVAPRTETERLIVGIWRTLLGIERPGVADDFFELGGDSLMGAQLIGRLKTTFGVQLASRVVYDRPTIEDLGALVEETLLAGAAPGAVTDALEPREATA